MSNDDISNTYLGNVSPKLFFQLVNAVALSGSFEEVASRVGFSQNDILMIRAKGGNSMELSKRFFLKWRMRMPTMRDVAVIMAKEPPIVDAVHALRQACPQLLTGLEPLAEFSDGADMQMMDFAAGDVPFEQQQVQQGAPDQPAQSPEVTEIAGIIDSPPQPQPQPPETDDEALGPQQTCPPQVVLKGLTAISFNADEISSVPQLVSPSIVEVRGNFCRVVHWIVRLQPDGSTASDVQAMIERLQELRHPSLACLMGTKLESQPDSSALSLDLFLPVYACTLADVLSDDASARRLSMPVRVGQLGSLMSALCHLHGQRLCLVRSPRLLACESIRLDAFSRPIIWWPDCLADCQDDRALLTNNFLQLLDLAVELLTGRMRHKDKAGFAACRGQQLKTFCNCQTEQELLQLEDGDESGFIDSRLVVDDEEDDSSNARFSAVLMLACRALRCTMGVAQGTLASDSAATRLQRMADQGA